ncbi:hypothetical protein ACJZ2D_004921 [Fusarium nematophilum]
MKVHHPPGTPKPPRRAYKASNAVNAQDSDFYVHPHLVPDQDPCKGRLLRASASVPAGTVLLVDSPYAIVPTVDPSTDKSILCSNLVCSQRVALSGPVVRCPRDCFDDVIWCSSSCRAADLARHEFECLWLKRNGDLIRQQEKELAEAYMGSSSGLPCLPSPDDLLALICKEETNTFGLYPRLTGPLDMIDRPVPRGECYGLGLYPRAAQFNHSCAPNVTHKPDSRGRMVYTAARDIAKGEECMITYFDLTVHDDLASRQELVQDQFQFKCTCERCLEEEAEENLAGIDSLPSGF